MPQVLFAIQALNQVITLVPMAQQLLAQFQAHRTALEQMLVEKRDPTPQEWDALNATISGLRSQLHAA